MKPQLAWIDLSSPRKGRVAVAIATFCAACASSCLLAWQLTLSRDARRAFLLQNALEAGQKELLELLLSFALVLPALLALLLLSRDTESSERPLLRTARLIQPLVVVAFLPFLFDWRIAQEHTLSYLLVLCVFVLAARRLLTGSLEQLRLLREERGAPPLRLPFGLPHWLCVLLVLLACSGYALYTGYYTILHHRQIGTTAFDLGIYDNLLYNAMHGRFFHSPVLFGPGNQNYLAGHAELAMVVFVPFYAIRPGAETMLIMQSVMFGFAALPLYLFAARVIERPLALVLSLGYLLFAPLHGPHFYDFHWLPFQIFFHFWLYYSLAARKTWLSVLALLMLFAIREDIAVGLCFLGLFLFLTSIRPRFGLALSSVAATWFLFEKFWLMPHLGDWHFEGMYSELFADGRSTYGSVIQTLISNPIYALSTFVRSVKLQYGLHMMTPLALLPLSRLPFLLLLIPACLTTLMTTGYWPTTEISFQYTTHWIPYLFFTSVLALAAMRRQAQSHSRRVAATCVMAVAMLSHSYGFGAVLQNDSFRGGFGKISFEMTPEAQQRYEDLMRLVRRIPQSASVAATEAVNPHISARLDAYAFRYDFGPVDYMLLSRYEVAAPDQHKIFVDQLSRHSYGLVAKAGEFYLFKRGQSTPATKSALAELGVHLPKSRP